VDLAAAAAAPADSPTAPSTPVLSTSVVLAARLLAEPAPRDHAATAVGAVASLELKIAAAPASNAVQPSMVRPPHRAAEFFAGIGLVRLALERRGWEVAFANDIDPDKAEMYRHNWPQDNHFLLGDIHALQPDQLPPCSLFTASFPCNDLSIAGKWTGLDGEHSSAFWGLVRLLERLGDRRPEVVLLENVIGFLQSHGGADLLAAARALNDLGYCLDAAIVDAARWTPQSRRRLFLVARSCPVPEAAEFAFESDARPQALCRFINQHPEVRWNLRPLPRLPAASLSLPDIVERLPPEHPAWWSPDRADYFMSQLSDRHRVLAEALIAGPQLSFATAFRRVRQGRSMAELRVDGLAGCLRTPRGGSGRQILLQAGGGERRVRLLTPRECARLQGVPDSYLIDVPQNQALFGFGDAVCVPAVEWVLDHLVGPRNALRDPQ